MNKITILGCGALGSHLCLLIRNLDCEISVIDYDRVEQKNTQSQFHPVTVIGKNKATALKEVMSFLFKKKIQAITHKLVENNSKELLSASSLVVDCLDNAEARRTVQTTVRQYGIPCLHGALAADGAYGLVEWDERFQIDSEVGQGQATCQEGNHVQFISIVSSYLALSVKRFIEEGKKESYRISPTGAIKV